MTKAIITFSDLEGTIRKHIDIIENRPGIADVEIGIEILEMMCDGIGYYSICSEVGLDTFGGSRPIRYYLKNSLMLSKQEIDELLLAYERIHIWEFLTLPQKLNDGKKTPLTSREFSKKISDTLMSKPYKVLANYLIVPSSIISNFSFDTEFLHEFYSPEVQKLPMREVERRLDFKVDFGNKPSQLFKAANSSYNCKDGKIHDSVTGEELEFIYE